MSDLTALEKSVREHLLYLQEQQKTANETEASSSEPSENTVHVTLAEWESLKNLQEVSLKMLSDFMEMLNEEKITLHQLTAEYVALIAEHDKYMNASLECIKRVEMLENKHNV